MKYNIRLVFIISLFICFTYSSGQGKNQIQRIEPLSAQPVGTIERIEPPFWWVGMEYNEIQLLIHGTNIAGAEVKSGSEKIKINEIHQVENADYLFVDISIDPSAKSGFYPLRFESKGEDPVTIPYELKERMYLGNGKQGFTSSDAIYLLMPDRFSNGDPANDNAEGMLEKADRTNPNGRHGGDIAGIRNHLDYIADMGFTALWINPLLENNMPAYSYHGYAITDFYRIDPRFGSNEEYMNLVEEAHRCGLKVIMDMVFNHCGTNHWFIQDLPMKDWINQWDSFTQSNFRSEVKIDPHASEYDKKLMGNGWFDKSMADLNQKNPFLMKYLEQNSIWWIEYSGIDGIRMDTYPYTDKYAMAGWAEIIQELYPNFTILGETWLQKTSHTSYWQTRTDNYDGYDSHIQAVTDFPLHYALNEALNEKEGWSEGLRRLYYVLSEDFLYSDPENLLIFPDNHDVTRYYTSMQEDLDKYKMGLAFLLTTRGIPQIYYGTEILMTGREQDGHGYIRQDFPGGWEKDPINAFTSSGLSKNQLEAKYFLQKILLWRQKTPTIHSGELKQFIPENNVYVYSRYLGEQCIVVILNNNNESIPIDRKRFSEVLSGFGIARDIISNKEYKITDGIVVPPMSPMILELYKE
jgi:glycosidase